MVIISIQNITPEPEVFGLFPRPLEFRQKMKENKYGKYTEFAPWRSVYRVNALIDTQDEQDMVLRGAKITQHILEHVPVDLEPEDVFAMFALPVHSHEDIENARNALASLPLCGGNHGHIALDYELLLKSGINGLLNDIESKLSNLPDISSCENKRKLNFYLSSQLSLKAVLDYVARFREKLGCLISEETNLTRKFELERILKALKNVPAEPADTFFEALQSLLIFHFAEQIAEENYTSIGRIDFILDRYYKQDINQGIITPSEVAEWIQLVLPRCCIMAGHGDSIILAGSRCDGTPFWNDLSYFTLDAARMLNLHSPQISLRYAHGCPRSLLARGFKVLRAGVPQPSFYNDEVVVPALMRIGYNKDHAYDYVNCQCVELTSAGRSNVLSGYFYRNLAKPVEILLNKGRQMVEDNLSMAWTLKEFPPDVPLEYERFEDFLEAYKLYLKYLLKDTVVYLNSLLHSRYRIISTLSSPFIEGCIEKGVPTLEGGALYNQTCPNFTGLVTAADSLAAIRQCIFEEKRLSLEELAELCRNNFEGHDEERLYLLNRCPKYGNNDPSVDSLVKWIFDMVANELDQYRNIYGEKFAPGYFAFTETGRQAFTLAATPDGRRFGEPPSGTLGGDLGREKKGLTALTNSAASLNHALASGGMAVNMSISPFVLKDEEGINKAVDTLLVYFEKGGMQAQFNCISKDKLREARKSPENFRDLLVRVAGFSTYFTLLNPVLQEEIINRIGHEF